MLARVVGGLGVAQGAVITLHDVHRWPLRECAIALGQPADAVLALLQVGRERARAALEAEVDAR